MLSILVGAPFFIMALLTMISVLTANGDKKSSSSSTPFECGMDPKLSARSPFSARFFLLAVLFLVFDIETALLLPSPSLSALSLSTLTELFLFIIILVGGLIHEWREGSLNWAS